MKRKVKLDSVDMNMNIAESLMRDSTIVETDYKEQAQRLEKDKEKLYAEIGKLYLKMIGREV